MKGEKAVGDPWKKYAPDHGVDLYACPKCWHITDDGNYDVLGADGAKRFCNQCNKQVAPRHVGWMRTDWLYPTKRPRKSKPKAKGGGSKKRVTKQVIQDMGDFDV